MVSISQLREALELRLQSSTKRSAVMSAGTQIYVRQYVESFLSGITDKDIANSLSARNAARKWLHNQPYARSTKQLAAITLAAFLTEEGAMNPYDKKILLGQFRSDAPDWGEKALTRDELERVLSHLARTAASGLTPARNLYVTALMTVFGMRISQALGLKCGDVSITAGIMQYRVAVKKGGFGKAKYRLKTCKSDLALPGCNTMTGIETMLDIHTRYLHFRAKPTGSQPLFVNRSGSEVSDDYYRQFYSDLGKETGIHLFAHKFRHTAGSMITAAAGIAQAADALDHSSVVITQNYVRRSLFDQAAILSQVFGGI